MSVSICIDIHCVKNDNGVKLYCVEGFDNPTGQEYDFVEAFVYVHNQALERGWELLETVPQGENRVMLFKTRKRFRNDEEEKDEEEEKRPAKKQKLDLASLWKAAVAEKDLEQLKVFIEAYHPGSKVEINVDEDTPVRVSYEQVSGAKKDQFDEDLDLVFNTLFKWIMDTKEPGKPRIMRIDQTRIHCPEDFGDPIVGSRSIIRCEPTWF